MGGTPNDTTYTGGPYGVRRPSQTPPASQHASSSTDMSRPSHGGSSSGGRPPSSASSVARSSDGRMFGGPGQRDSTRSAVNPHNEDALQRHYAALRIYLAASLHDEKGNMKPNRARDKLLRLSVTQFMELSTDVFDELIRREDERLQRVQNVPRSLPPKQNFHPKRNQARQKLSTLPIERFRQLATDVYYELERRIPRFAGGDIDRPSSGASSRAPSRGGMRPPVPAMRPPPGAMGEKRSISPGGPNGMGPPGPNGMGPPRRAQTFQSNTMIPNKSTMVEDDSEVDEDEPAFGLNRAVTGFGDDGVGSSAEHKERLAAQDTEITELKEKIDDLGGKLQQREQELEEIKVSAQKQEADTSSERNEWLNLRNELEKKHLAAQTLNDDLRRELNQLHNDKSESEREIHAQHDRSLGDLHTQLENAQVQTDELHHQLQTYQDKNQELRTQLEEGVQRTSSNSEYQRRIELLQKELAQQQKVTKEVQEEATMYLQEMRDLSKQNDEAIEQEERLAGEVTNLEKEIDIWRQRYANVKAQNKSLRASTLGLGLQTAFDSGSLFKKDSLVSEDGLVKDVDVTRFQISVDELLKAARQSETAPMLDGVKNVILSVQSITSTVGTDGYPTPAPSPLTPDGNAPRPEPIAKLKARVTGTANSLITATKQHASASGLSPVALLDAAASNLTSAVVELVKSVGIRPSPRSELEDHEYDDAHDSVGSFYDDRVSVVGDEFVSPPPGAASAPAVQVSAPEQPKSAAPSLGRSGTFKKVNGWFGWGKTPTSEEPPPTPMATANGYAEEYDPYR